MTGMTLNEVVSCKIRVKLSPRLFLSWCVLLLKSDAPQVTCVAQVRTSKAYSTDRVQLATSTGNISTSRALFSNFSAPCPDSVDGQVDGWDAESYHAALNNWMRCLLRHATCAHFYDFLTHVIRIIDTEKKSSENNEDQRRPRIMLALQQCVMSMQVLVPFNAFLGLSKFLTPFLQHSAASWYHLVSFALAKENNDSKAAAALLQDAVITVPRCLALRLMSVLRTHFSVFFTDLLYNHYAGTATF